ncbi:MAG: hypothetical protein QW279_16010 [Candidatus Jordarchaeaceae archaeon]
MKERDAQNILKRYFMVFPDAWNDFLKNVEKGDFPVPSNEAELRSYLFAKCLEIMRRKKFEKPYEIFAEDKEIFEGRKADLALGWLEDGRFVAIELKHGPSIEGIRMDIEKLQKFVKSRAIFGFFAMIGNSKYEYQKYLNLKDLGIQLELREPLKATLAFKDGEKSFYQWRLIKAPFLSVQLETLLVGILQE